MPGILRDFLVNAISVVVFSGPAILTDLVLTAILFPAPGLVALLRGADTSAYLEAPVFGWGTPLSLGELFTQARILVPYSLPLNVMLVYVAVRSVLAVVGYFRGERQAMQGLMRNTLTVWMVAVVLLAAFNQFVPLLRPANAAYATNIQYAIPRNAEFLHLPPAFLLTEFNLATIPRPLESRAFHLPATTLFGLTGILAVTYIISVIAHVGYLLALVVLLLVQTIGRWWFIVAALLVVAMPLLQKQEALRRVANWVVGITISSVLFIPFLNYVTNGVLFALPGLAAQFASGVAARLISATVALGSPPANFNPSAFCEALLISNCSPFQNPGAPLANSVLDALPGYYARLSAFAVVLLVVEVCFSALVIAVLSQGVFWGIVAGAGVGGALAGVQLNQALAAGWRDAQSVPIAGKVNAHLSEVLATVSTRAAQAQVTTTSAPQEKAKDKESKRHRLAAALRQIGGVVSLVKPGVGMAVTAAAEVVEPGGVKRLLGGEGEAETAPRATNDINRLKDALKNKAGAQPS